MRNYIQMQLIEKGHIDNVRITKGKAVYPRDRHPLVIAYIMVLIFVMIVVNMLAWNFAPPARKAELKASIGIAHTHYDCRDGREYINGKLVLNDSGHPIECIEKEKAEN